MPQFFAGAPTDDVERLCRLLDGIPLALELAAGCALAPGRIADRLGGRHGLLPASADGAGKVLAVVRLGHELLAPRERVLLRRLAVFAGAFDAPLAGAVCGDGGILRRAEVPRLLDRLVAARLVTGSYALRGVVKEYAAERLREAGEHDLLRDRHLRAVREAYEECHEGASLARRQPWPERVRHLRRARALGAECRAALGRAVERGEAASGLRLARAAMAMGVSCPDDALERLPALGAPGELADCAKVLLGCARGAVEPVVAGVDGLRVRGYSYWLGVGYNAAVRVCFANGRCGLGRRYLGELEAAAAADDDLVALAGARMARGDLALLAGEVHEARRHAGAALTLAREAGDPRAIVAALRRLAAVADTVGDHDEAARQRAGTLPILHAIGEEPPHNILSQA
ncbi:hypothetical protein [Nonomuraea ferruginea]|uniref:Transcriptional regulator n=2 Tax=Nonomuraea ferruginea TaxID=46174 RepID=A0ABT4SSV3_9ACTN|nr:hypothetical protein [Nonomuraea ferruginea]MDA0640083.1 hypothetical protein [Nonomuraea ferruginea]